MSTPIRGIADAISNELKRYNLVLQEDIDNLMKEVSKEVVDELRNSSSTPRLTGDYAAGWKRSKIRGAWIVHNETDYQLTHLLEKGHAKVGGGRVRAYVHIAPIAQKAVDKIDDRIDEIVRLRG